MLTTRSLSTSWVRALAALAVLVTMGCHKADADRVPVVPVAGAVVFDGKPTPGALVVFHPAQGDQSPTPPAQGTVRDDGTFELTTYTANDGAPPGEYKVTIEWRQTDQRQRRCEGRTEHAAGPLQPAEIDRSRRASR